MLQELIDKIEKNEDIVIEEVKMAEGHKTFRKYKWGR